MCTILRYGCFEITNNIPQFLRLGSRHTSRLPQLNAKRVGRRLLHTSNGACTAKLTTSYLHGRSDVPLVGATIGQLLDRSVERFPDRDAAIFYSDNVRRTFAEIKAEIDQLAAGFVALGLKRGDRVGIWSPSCLEWILTQYATAKAGLVLVNVNPAYQTPELEFALKKVGVKAVIAAEKFKTQDYYEMLFQINPELVNCNAGELKSHRLPDLSHVIMIGEKRPGTYSFQELMEAGGRSELDFIEKLQNKIQFDDPVNIQFTSGTTGNPKGATLSHHNLLNNSYFSGLILGYDKQEARICDPVPLYHCFGMVVGGMQMAVNGSTLVYPNRSFDGDSTLRAVQDEKCTSLYGTPTMFIDMLNHPEFDKFDLTSLHTGCMAGSPCPIEIMRQVIDKMHMPDVTIAYGTTENSPVTFMSLPDDPIEKRVATIGRPHPHVEVKVVNDEGEIVPIGVKGELMTRGYMVMLNYWNDKEKTEEVIGNDRWYSTGDLAIMDEDGYGYIVGRIKDMVIRGGENIYPLEIEQFLYEHPKIEDVQVIGVPDERMGEELCAWVKLRHGQKAKEQEIKDFCKGKIAHFKIPRYVLFVKEFPLTVTGKIQKYKMREASLKLLDLEHVTPH